MYRFRQVIFNGWVISSRARRSAFRSRHGDSETVTAKDERRIWLEPHVVNRLLALRGRREVRPTRRQSTLRFA
jgi:hypothetical protein